jgi:hypothetical protein
VDADGDESARRASAEELRLLAEQFAAEGTGRSIRKLRRSR